MKKIWVLSLLMGCLMHAQNKQLLYDYTDIPQSLLLNPGAEVNYRWHVGIPLLSHLHVNAGSSGVSAFDLFTDDGVDFNTKFRSVLNDLDRNDFFAINQQLEVFSGGFRPGGWGDNRYFSFGMYEEIDIHAYFPKDLAVLAYEGNGGPNINRVFNLGDLNLQGEFLTVFHFGFNQKVNDKFTFGARGKIYSSIFNFRSTNNSGSFYSVPGQNNFYQHIAIADLELQTSGYASLRDIESDNTSDGSKQVLKKFKRRAFLGGNLGLGFDVGFTYHPSEQWTVTGSLQDVGFIRHSKDVETYRVDGEYALEGLDLLFPGIDDADDVNNYWEDLKNELEDEFGLDTLNTKYTTWRPIKLNASLKYSFGKERSKDCDCAPTENGYLNAVGAQLFMVSRPRRPQMALTAFYYRRLFDFLSAKATYTVDSYSFTNVGLGVSTHFANANFYLMVDNLLEFQNLAKANAVSFQLGFNYILPQGDKPY